MVKDNSIAAQYDYVLPRIQDILIARQVPVPRWEPEGSPAYEKLKASIAAILVSHDMVPTAQIAGLVAQRFTRMMTGLGLLQPLMEEEGIEEIIVRNGHVFVEKSGGIDYRGHIAADRYFYQVSAAVAQEAQQMLRDDAPYVVAGLADGSRFTALVPPASTHGTAINIRRFGVQRMDLPELVQLGTFQPRTGNTLAPGEVDHGNHHGVLPPPALFLTRIAEQNAATVLISGGFSTGKTTQLGAITAHFPPNLQVAVLETFSELNVVHEHALRAVVPLRAQAFTMQSLLNLVITRMRPDVILVGEIVGSEAGRFLEAANLGVRAWATIHGNSAVEALHRLEHLALSPGKSLEAVRQEVGLTVDVVVHMAKDGAKRYVQEIIRVKGVQNNQYVTEQLYKGGPGRDERLDAIITDSFAGRNEGNNRVVNPSQVKGII